MKNILFIPIPKTATGSIVTFFRENNKIEIFKKCNNRVHATALELKNEIKPDEWNKLFKFAFVRNPWDRMVSWFFFSGGKEENFINWVKQSYKNKNFKGGDEKKNAVVRFLLQHEYIFDRDFYCMLDFVGKFETIDEDIKKICDKLNFKFDKIPHINSTKHRHYSEYYTQETRDIVNEMCNVIITKFNYKFN